MAPLFRRIRTRIAGALGKRAKRHETEAKRVAAVGELYSHVEKAIGPPDLKLEVHETADVHRDYASVLQKKAKRLHWLQRLMAPKPPKEKK